MKRFVRRVLFVIGPQRRQRWYVLVALAGIVSVLEAMSALAIGALLALVVAPGRPLEIPLLGERLDFLDASEALTPYLTLGFLLCAFFIFRGVMSLLQIYAQSRVGQNTGVELSERLLAGYLRMPYVFHLSRNSSELIRNAYTTAAEVIVYVLIPLVQALSEILVMIGLALVLLWAAPVPALLAGLVLGSGVLVIQRATRPRLLAYGVESTRFMSTTLEWLQHSTTGTREIRLLGAEPFFLARFLEERRKLARANYLRTTVVEIPRLAIETAVVLSVVLLLLFTVAAERSAQEAFAVIGLFAYAAFRALPSVNRVIAAVNNCRFGAAALDAVCSDLEQTEGPDLGREPVVVLEGPIDELRVEGVTFSYEGASQPALNSVTVALRGGEYIGIAGGTGSGKSTLIHLLAGLVAPREGRLVFNGNAVSASGWRWGGQLGLVTQEVFLINDSIRRNIALGVPDGDIDEDRIDTVIELTQLRETVSGSPAGLDTVVGDRGARLSGGQRQRISIARALYQAPDLLILDEGTSALDVLTEGALIQALNRASAPRTLIHVAHRLTSLQDCDRILVFESGRLVDEGSFHQLAMRNDAFREAARAATSEVN